MAAIAEWMRGLSDSLWSSLLRTGAVYASLVFVLLAIDTLSKDAPIWPLSLYTVIWILALSFPVTTLPLHHFRFACSAEPGGRVGSAYVFRGCIFLTNPIRSEIFVIS